MDSNTKSPSKPLSKPFRQLIEELEVSYKIGSHEQLDGAINALLARVKYDIFEARIQLNTDTHETELVGYSSNPEAVYQRLLEYPGEWTGASLTVTCGHCGQIDQMRNFSSYGRLSRNHIKFLIDNFPEEL